MSNRKANQDFPQKAPTLGHLVLQLIWGQLPWVFISIKIFVVDIEFAKRERENQGKKGVEKM
jgi:hypothetical protein